jgi:hypothetical protein
MPADRPQLVSATKAAKIHLWPLLWSESFAIDANHAGIVWIRASCRSPSAGVMAARSAPRTSSPMAAAWSKRGGDPTLSGVTEQLRSAR